MPPSVKYWECGNLALSQFRISLDIAIGGNKGGKAEEAATAKAMGVVGASINSSLLSSCQIKLDCPNEHVEPLVKLAQLKKTSGPSSSRCRSPRVAFTNSFA